MDTLYLQENTIYTIPKPDGLIKKILTSSATLEDFTKYDEQISQYLSKLGTAFLDTEREEIKRFYCFLTHIIQQFQEFLTFVAHVNFDFTYRKNMSYTQHNNNLLNDMYYNDTMLMFRAKFRLDENEVLPVCEYRLIYIWLTTIIDMEETFSPNVSFFSDYHDYMKGALQELTRQNYFL